MTITKRDRWDALAAQLTQAGHECRASRLPMGTVRQAVYGAHITEGYEIVIRSRGDLVVIRDQYDRRTYRRTAYQVWRENRDGFVTAQRFGVADAASVIGHVEAMLTRPAVPA